MRQRGIIRGAILDVDPAAIGRPVQALIAVRIRPPSRRNIEALRDWAARLPDAVGVFVISGSEDVLLHVAVLDNRQPYAFVSDKLTEHPKSATSAPASSTSTSATRPLPPPPAPAASRANGPRQRGTQPPGEAVSGAL